MTTELHCPKCKEIHTIKKGQCKNCGYIFKKAVADFYNLTFVKPKPIPRKKPIPKEDPVKEEELILEDIFCPGCGQRHVTNNQYCLNCKTDMEPIILEYKDKNLPIKFNDLQETRKEGSIRRGSAGTSYTLKRSLGKTDACCMGCDFIDAILSVFTGCC